MIKSKDDLKAYIAQDVQRNNFDSGLISYYLNDIRVFLRALRKLEYIRNTKRGLIWKLLTPVYIYRFKQRSKKLGFSIPPNVAGPGLTLPHYGNIVINRKARLGANCKIHIGVNIGAEYGKSDNVPTIGNNCYIAPGAKLYGKIEIADNALIGANSVVNKSFRLPGSIIVGMPATCIRVEGQDAKI